MCLFVSAEARQDKVIEVARVLIKAKADVDMQVLAPLLMFWNRMHVWFVAILNPDFSKTGLLFDVT